MHWFSRLGRSLTWQRIPTASLAFRDLGRETRLLLLYSVAYVGAALATGLATRAHPMPIWGATDFLQDVTYAVLFKIGLLLVVPLAMHRAFGYRLRDLTWGRPGRARDIVGVVIAYAAGVCINLGRVPAAREAFAAHAPLEAWARLGIGLLLPLLQAGLPEEFVYRSMLQTRLEAAWGRTRAILVTLILFVAWHLPTRMLLAHGIEGQAGDPVSVVIGTGIPVAIVGLVLGWAWDRWRNLPVLVALHTGIDTLPILSSMLQAPPT